MGLDPGVQRRIVLDAIVLAFHHSKLRDHVGTDALRTVLSGQYRMMIAEGSLDLETLWDLIKDQPGVSEASALAPFSALKLWEKELELPVALPTFMAASKASTLTAEAASLAIPRAERESALNPENTPIPTPAPSKKPSGSISYDGLDIEVPEGEASVAAKPKGPRLRDKGWFRGVLVVAGALGFAVSGFTLYSVFSANRWDSAEISLPSELPVSNPKRLGSEVGVTLDNSAWMSKPEKERRAILTDAFKSVESEDVSVLFVKSNGEIVATVQRSTQSRKIVVRFR